MLTLLDASLATVQKMNPIISLWDDVLYYGENVQDVLLCEHRSVLGIKLIFSEKKLNRGYIQYEWWCSLESVGKQIGWSYRRKSFVKSRILVVRMHCWYDGWRTYLTLPGCQF